MVRSEPFGAFAIASIAKYVDEVLVTDTGSESEYIDALEYIQNAFPKGRIKIEYKQIENAQNWSIDECGTISNDNSSASELLGNIRRAQHNKSNGEIIWLLDGDEVYTDCFAYFISRSVPSFSSNNQLVSLHLPFVDFLNLEKDVRYIHKMGRIFKRDKTIIQGNFPKEMHCDLEGNPLNSYCMNNGNIHFEWDNYNEGDFVFHLESIKAPHRKPLTKYGEYTGRWPEVFERYKDVPEMHRPIEKFVQERICDANGKLR